MLGKRKEDESLSILETLQKTSPDRNVVFTAVEKLETPEEIRRFRDEYINFLQKEGGSEDVRFNAKETANSNIGYILGYYGEKIIKRWFSALDDVSHPIFGRNILSVSAEEAFQKGVQMGEQFRRRAGGN